MRVIGLVLGLCGFLLATGAAAAAEGSGKILLAHGAISANVAPLWIAKEQGFYKKYGADVDLVFIIAGRATQAMLAGQVPVGLVGATHVTNTVTAGGDLVMILGLQNTLDYLFIARPAVKSGEDLKGKKVAIGTPSGSASLATYVALDYLGLNPRRDNIVLLGIGGVPERLGALRAGSVEATSLSPEFGQVVISEGYRVLVDTGKEKIPFQSSGLVVSRSLIRSNPQLIDGLVKATVEGVAFIHKPANKEIVLKSLARNLRLDKPERVEKAYQTLVGELPKKPCPTLRGVASVLKLMSQHGLNPKASQVKPEEVADMSFCNRLEESGFFRRLY
ncbi:MAG TPA: ABC transporter substrate-binding protein [candidate division Zixibacteria bacterium]|nr:ABC transporter substrate-binding protein [candidate division Zixibacteria bacterium]